MFTTQKTKMLEVCGSFNVLFVSEEGDTEHIFVVDRVDTQKIKKNKKNPLFKK